MERWELLKLRYPEELPVSRRRAEIAEAVRDHPVVIVCGDTGSGKTTQLPKIALELGRGVDGRCVGCTQPRRIAATSVARRVAEEMEVPLGAEVGYQIRFEDRTDAKRTRVKFMTDGILLAETQGDPLLGRYDTLIVDEAHERSLNIDFILGYLQRTLEKRDDLKVILSSATLDAGSFSEFFGGAPVVEVEGRAYPVEDEYQVPLHDREPLAEQVGRAVEDLAEYDRFGDTLVFLPGEREIRESADLLEGRKLPDTLVLPLYARQSGSEQQAVFQPMRTKRRVILATNVAETSLTIPGIRFVVDSGIARISRFDPGAGIQRLQVEPISQASARQRRGRCGRISEGICVRLYSEEDYGERSEFTDPEILRSNLAGVVLQMEHLGLGDPLRFPFVDPPQPKRVSRAYGVLEEIGAIRKKGKQVSLTRIGRDLARLPVDTRVGRLLVAAREEGCLLEALVVASALSVQDPRDRPRDKQEQADSAHGQFRDKRSDFTGWLRWWHAIEEARAKSNNELRRFCRKNFLNYRRVQEWRNLHREIRSTLRQMKWKLPPPKKRLSDPKDTYSEPLHRALLAAIPSHIGMHQGAKKGYRGARNATFWLFPGSGVFGSAPAWVMAFERVETAKLYARNVASFDPGWIEKVAPHLCRYRYSNPHWVPDQGAVYGDERVLAFGLPVVEKRRIHYGRIDRAKAREIFLLEALVNGNTRAPMPCLANNRETLVAAERLEHKMRRLGGLLHPEAVVAFYEDRIPPDICTQKEFEKWVSRQPGGAIDFTLEDCLLPQLEPIRIEDFPDTIHSPDGTTEFSLCYLHNPSEPADGITTGIPLVELPHLPDWFGEWLVPGWLEMKVSALLRGLRKEIRTRLPSNREVVEDFLVAWEGYEPACGLVEAMIDHLHEAYGYELTCDSFDLDRIPEYLRMRFEIVDDSGRVVGAGKDLPDLRTTLAGRVRDRFAEVARGKFERARIGTWSFGDLPKAVELDRHTTGFPRLFDNGEKLPAMRLFASPECGAVQHRIGVARLFRAEQPDLEKRLLAVLESSSGGGPEEKSEPSRPVTSSGSGKKGGDFGSLAAAFGAVEPERKKIAPPPKREGAPRAKDAGGKAGLRYLTPEQGWMLGHIGPEPARNRDDLLHRILGDRLGEPLARGDWERATRDAETALFEDASAACGRVARILSAAERVGGLLAPGDPGYEESLADAREHFARLLAPGWLLADDLVRMAIHLQGLETRLTRMLGAPPAKDLDKLERYRDEAVTIWREEPAACDCGLCPEAVVKAGVRAADEDLRLKVFAPEVRARMK